MKSNRMQALSKLDTRQKVTGVILVVVVLFILWEVIGIFRGGPRSTPVTTVKPPVTAYHPPPPVTPKPAQLTTQPTSPQQADLLRLQQQSQQQYISALNELQMLRLTREIVETNQAIVAARLATVTSEKSIVSLLAPPPPPPPPPPETYAKAIAAQAIAVPVKPPVPAGPAPIPEASYTVVSVTQLMNRWRAVLGYQNNLYSVKIGDILPADGSQVVKINSSGVTLQRNGVRRRVSLVPII